MPEIQDPRCDGKLVVNYINPDYVKKEINHYGMVEVWTETIKSSKVHYFNRSKLEAKLMFTSDILNP